MDLIKVLKQFKAIEPDKSFATRSRGLILGAQTKTPVGFWGVVLRNIESGAALALTGLLIFVILGGLSAWNQAFSPAPFEALNPASLRAEAQAVDIQIELTNLSYESAPAKTGESTAAFSPALTTSEPQNDAQSEEKAFSIDEALDFLSE